ncbi:MAG: esterase family protein [Clostridiales bacterium]|nr:esterase family protein [Clostridiales bacterium]
MAWIQASYFSDALGMCVNCNVILPVKADMGKPDRTRRPVLWLLHGAHGNCDDWLRSSNVERYATRKGLAVVMPSAHLSSYMNMAHGGNYYDYITQELPAKMRQMFPLSDRPDKNFIAGLSMGGRGALMIGLANPEQYSVIGCFSAGLDIPAKAPYRDEVLGGKRPSGYGDIRQNVKTAAKSGHPPKIYHSCGTEDPFLSAARKARDVIQAVPGDPFRYTYEEGPGAHEWDFWDNAVRTFIERLPLKAAPQVWR